MSWNLLEPPPKSIVLSAPPLLAALGIIALPLVKNNKRISSEPTEISVFVFVAASILPTTLAPLFIFISPTLAVPERCRSLNLMHHSTKSTVLSLSAPFNLGVIPALVNLKPV